MLSTISKERTTYLRPSMDNQSVPDFRGRNKESGRTQCMQEYLISYRVSCKSAFEWLLSIPTSMLLCRLCHSQELIRCRGPDHYIYVFRSRFWASRIKFWGWLMHPTSTRYREDSVSLVFGLCKNWLEVASTHWIRMNHIQTSDSDIPFRIIQKYKAKAPFSESFNHPDFISDPMSSGQQTNR